MSTITPGSSRPDPTQPILVGTRVPPPPVSPAQPGPRRPMGLIVAVVVLAVAVVGMGGWAVLRPYLGASGQTGTPATGPVTTPATTGPAASGPTTQPVPPPATGTVPGTTSPTVVPFDVTQGLAAGVPSEAYVIGVWDGVAVFQLIGHYFTQSNVLRGVEVATGAVLWTLDSAPDGAGFQWLPWAGANGSESQASVYSAGSIAIQVGKAPYRRPVGPGVTPACPGPEAVLLVSVREGTASELGSWQPTCANGPGSEMVTAPRVTAYHDGIVIMTGETDRASADVPGGRRPILTTTSAYQATDLAHPLWQVDGTVADSGEGGATPFGAWGPSGPVVMDRWVATVSGEYVDLYTGAPSGLTYSAWDATAGSQPYQYVLWTAGRLYTVGRTETGATDPGNYTLSAWSSPTATGPDWTHPFAPGSWLPNWGNKGYSGWWSCYSQDIGVVDVRPGDGGGATDVVAVDLGTGGTLSSQRYGTTPNGGCALIVRGDQEIVAIATGTAVEFRDAVTGRLMAPEVAWADAMGGSTGSVDLRPCGQGLVCAITWASTGSEVVGLFYENGTVTLGDPIAMPNVYATAWETGSGPLIIGWDWIGTGQFII